MKFIIGTKEGMTQVFDEKGVCHGATILRVVPATVTAVMTTEKEGYSAVQIASGAQKEHRVGKAQKGQLGGSFKTAKEFRPRKSHGESADALTKGATLDASVFNVGDMVVVSATSKGKGFQGVVKRHNFRGGPASHGQKHSLREPGSIGSVGFMHVIKGTRMAGRMGGERITLKNLRVLQVNKEANLLLVSGAVPGRKGSLVEVRNA
jgi:large subunit ribosomal protein L3